MSSAIRNAINRKILQTLQESSHIKCHDITSNLHFKCKENAFSFFLPLKTKDYDIQSEAENIVKNCESIFPGTTVNLESSSSISFSIPRDTIVREVLENNVERLLPPQVSSEGQKILVEFSSPNIAKPFHVGHLRSTIIGSYLANLHNFLNFKTTKINYLGDWGTQFGYIQLGIDELNISDDVLKSDPMTQLYNAYVWANKQGENDPLIAKRAREMFESLEKGDKSMSAKLETLRKYTTAELRNTYGRLGVNFDEFHWESMYSRNAIEPVIRKMENILINDKEDRKVVAINENRNVPILKSDGSTLYITRDIAAAIDRYEKYNYDLMYYVTENAQTDHFTNLITILGKMGEECSGKIKHVKFGKIRGMSTRRGTAVFLSDFLDEARTVMREKQLKSATTKVSLDPTDNSCDTLGISAVIIHDLKQKRQRDYEFNWNTALDIKGETGVKLQYSHCRLTSLEETSGAKLSIKCDSSLLHEPIIDDVIAKIIQFDEMIIASYRALEPCYLAKYLFDLSHVVNKALRELRVKDVSPEIASQRLLLFRVTKNVLATGMSLLGLQPLKEM